MTDSTNLQTVQAIYAAFGRGDVGAITALVADDVSWDAWSAPSAQRATVPWLRERRGKDGVGEFFAALSAGLEFTDFRVAGLLAGPDKVAAEIEFDAIARSTGRPIHVEEMHLWSFGPDGRVSAYRDYFDTAKDVEALR